MGGRAADRKALEDLWRARLANVRLRFDLARNHTNEIHRDRRSGALPSPDGSLVYQQAVGEETMALAEYRRVLRVFTSLVLRGEIPDESGRPDPTIADNHLSESESE